MSYQANSLTIGSLSKATKVHVETIRYYQRRGLLAEPQRPVGGIRRYGTADIDRLIFVKTAQQLGFSLNEISELLRLEDGAHCQKASILAEQKLRDVREKIAGLEKIEKALDEMIGRCQKHQGKVACPLIASLHQGVSGTGS